jgi:hypothetical protein
MTKATASRYPTDWKVIALHVKEREGWHCYRCGVLGLRPGERLFSPKDRAFLIQVHHWDCDPGNNCDENLVALCTLAVEHRLPSPAPRRKPVAVQLGLWNTRTLYRQMELWDREKVFISGSIASLVNRKI